MQTWKKGLLIGMAACCLPVLSACSAKETIGILWNSSDDSEESTEPKVDLGAANVDENVEKPTINNEMGDPVTYTLNAEAEPLTVDASVSDGGELSYQWYSNNVDSNGGGTEITGETSASFTPPTGELGTMYYYVVVTNTLDGGIQLTASSTKSVTITEENAEEEVTDAEGTWQQDDKGWWFQYTDGTYPVSKWELIDGSWYVFDENGYMRTGWYQEGESWYYLYEDGSMAHDTDVEGYHIGSDGIMEE